MEIEERNSRPKRRIEALLIGRELLLNPIWREVVG